MYMEDEAFAAAASGDVTKWPFSEINERDMSEEFKKIISPSGNSLLHVAARSGQTDMTGIMAGKFRFMMTMQNSKGDTALHVATHAGKISTVKKIVNCADLFNITYPTDDNNSLLKMKNERGNTALHEAFVALKAAIKDKKKSKGDHSSRKEEKIETLVAIARCLVSADPNASYMQNIAGYSPLCLAAVSGNVDILTYILEALPEDDDCVTKLQGKSPVKVAIEKRRLDLLEIMEKQKPQLLRIRDEQGNTPMHWAASIGYVKGVRHLYNIDRNNATKRNNEGLYPLHLACENEHVGVMDVLLTNWPDPTELYNNKGQNILHVAAKTGKVLALRRILKSTDIDCNSLVNEVDNDGNTPMHLAAMHGHVITVGHLILRVQAKLNIVNNANLTAYDVAEQQSEKLNPDFSGNLNGQKNDDKKDSKSEPTGHKNGEQSKSEIDPEIEKETDLDTYTVMMTLAVLFVAHNVQTFFAGGTFLHGCQKVINNLQKKTKQNFTKDDINNRITNLLIVAALIAGATFAASVQLGSSNSDSSSGAPAPSPLAASQAAAAAVIKKEVAIKFFTVCNTIAMYTSITAAIALCWTQLQDMPLASTDVWFASMLVAFALYMSCLAFFASVYMLADVGDSFIAVMAVLQALFLCFLTVRSIQLLVPFRMKKLFILFVYFYHSLFWYFVYSVSLICRKSCFCCCFGPCKQEE